MSPPARIPRIAPLLALALTAGCGVNTDTGTAPTGAPTATSGRQSAPPAATERVQALAPWQKARGRLVLVATAAPGPYASFTIALDAVEVRQSGEWVPVASADDLDPANLAAAKAPLLLAVGTPPADPCQAVRLRFKPGQGACALAASPKQEHPLALPAQDRIELPLDDVAIEPAQTTVIALRANLAKVAVKQGAHRITPQVFALADASPLLGALSGAVAPPAAMARVWACWAPTGAPIAWADADPSDGAFTISGLPAGAYCLRITAGGYLPLEDRSQVYQVKPAATAQAAPVVLTRR